MTGNMLRALKVLADGDAWVDGHPTSREHRSVHWRTFETLVRDGLAEEYEVDPHLRRLAPQWKGRITGDGRAAMAEGDES